MENRMNIFQIFVLTLSALMSVSWAFSAQPAPTISDDFSDGRYEKRTGKDAAGKPLPEWTVSDGAFEAKDGYLRGIRSGRIMMKSPVAYGTWEWKYRYPSGQIYLHGKPMYSAGCMFVMSDDVKSPDQASGYWWGGKNDTHMWFQQRTGGGAGAVALLHNVPHNWGVNMPNDDRWHIVTVTRDANGTFALYHDGEPVSDGSGGLFTNVVDKTHTSSLNLWFQSVIASKDASAEVLPQFDDLKIWDGQVVTPDFQAQMKRTAGKVNVLVDQVRGGGTVAMLYHYKAMMEMFEKQGAVLKVINTTKLTPSLLDNFEVYVVLASASYTKDEQDALAQFIRQGGRALVMGGGATANAAPWLKEFGMTFRAPKGSEVLDKVVDHPLTQGVKTIHGLGYTYLDAAAPAKALMSSEKPGAGVGLAVYQNKGRIVCIADEWPLGHWKGAGGRGNPAVDMPEEGFASSKYDHRRLAQNIVDWLLEGLSKTR